MSVSSEYNKALLQAAKAIKVLPTNASRNTKRMELAKAAAALSKVEKAADARLKSLQDALTEASGKGKGKGTKVVDDFTVYPSDDNGSNTGSTAPESKDSEGGDTYNILNVKAGNQPKPNPDLTGEVGAKLGWFSVKFKGTEVDALIKAVIAQGKRVIKKFQDEMKDVPGYSEAEDKAKKAAAGGAADKVGKFAADAAKKGVSAAQLLKQAHTWKILGAALLLVIIVSVILVVIARKKQKALSADPNNMSNSVPSTEELNDVENSAMSLNIIKMQAKSTKELLKANLSKV